MKDNIKEIINQCLYPLFPRRCEMCGEVVSPQTQICDKCEKEIEITQEDLYFYLPGGNFFSGISAPFYYSNSIKKCILGLKFGGITQNANVLAKYMAKTVKLDYRDKCFDLVMSVPLTRHKKLKRGFNQSELIAKRTAKILSVKYEGKVLYRAFEKVEQKKLTREERLKEILSAFKIKNKEKIKGKTILLCDDVVTTGATFNECSKMLIEGGAKEVYCIAAAVAKGR